MNLSTQLPDTLGINYYEADQNLPFLLRQYVDSSSFEQLEPLLQQLGRVASEEIDPLAHVADKHPPVLQTYNRRGEHVNEVSYHPAYRELERIGYSQFGMSAMTHRAGVMGRNQPFKKIEKYALWSLFAQGEFGLCCPMSMTDAAATVLTKYASEEMKQKYVPKLTSTSMDDLFTAGQFMTEKHGGSDVGENTVSAKLNGDHYEIYGEKWFCSNVSGDIALVLARPEGAQEGSKGLAMFLVPKYLEDGTHNHYTILRLKDKLGTKDMASGEVNFHGAIGYVVGSIENGFKQMMSMVNASRLSNAVRSTGIMRRSFLEAIETAKEREAFGGKLIDLPMMQENLVEMQLDVEAAQAMILYTAHQFDENDQNVKGAKEMMRILTPILKGYICKRARYVSAEAMEVRGGNGYIEEWVNPRLVRDAHLGSIWEGTTNIVALDVIRAMRKERAGEVLLSRLRQTVTSLSESSELFTMAQSAVDAQVTHVESVMKDVVKSTDREVDAFARHFLELLYHTTVLVRLLEEAAVEVKESKSYRKLYVFFQYYRRYVSREPRSVQDAHSTAVVSKQMLLWQPIHFEDVEEYGQYVLKQAVTI